MLELQSRHRDHRGGPRAGGRLGERVRRRGNAGPQPRADRRARRAAVHRQQHHRDRASPRRGQDARGPLHRAHQLVRGELESARLLYRDQKGAGDARRGKRYSGLRAAPDADVRLVRPQAPRLACPLHAARAVFPVPGRRTLSAPATLRRRFLQRRRRLHRDAAAGSERSTSPARRRSTTST